MDAFLRWLCVLMAMCCEVYGCSEGTVYDSIVVGMGAAGSAAASALAQGGRTVLALEAQDRLGGRVHTVPFGDSLVELGAEWIHGTENSPTYDLAIQHNITLVDQMAEKLAYFSNGTVADQDLVVELSHVGFHAYHNPPARPTTVGLYVSKKTREYIKLNHPELQNNTDFVNGYLGYMERRILTCESAYSWNDVSTMTMAKGLGGSQHISFNKYGYKTLFELLLNTYNNGSGYPNLEVKLNTEVTEIHWSQHPDQNVIVTTKDGAAYTAKNVIVTVSIGVLQERYTSMFSPALPDDKVRAIKTISIGICAKMAFLFPYVWWPENRYIGFIWRNVDIASLSEADQWLLKIAIVTPPLANDKALIVWACGEAAEKVESLSDADVKKKMLDFFKRFMGGSKTIPEPLDFIKSMFGSSPFIRGAFSYNGLNVPNYWGARDELGRPLVDSSGTPRVLFAGEASEPLHFATVHGAIESGRREANRIVSG